VSDLCVVCNIVLGTSDATEGVSLLDNLLLSNVSTSVPLMSFAKVRLMEKCASSMVQSALYNRKKDGCSALLRTGALDKWAVV
jgi:hypothetical protein